MQGLALGSGGLLLAEGWGIFSVAHAAPGEAGLTMILVDYGKCTGCRTCETVCSAANHPVDIGGDGYRFDPANVPDGVKRLLARS